MFKAMWAERENEVVVVWKRPEAQINQFAEIIYCFDVCICSTEMKMPAKIKHYISSTHDSDSWVIK